MHIHILGICGTFMGSLAVLAKELGHRVTGSDANVYPPMRKPGLMPACSNTQANMLLVVVLPWVPAAASTQRPCST